MQCIRWIDRQTHLTAMYYTTNKPEKLITLMPTLMFSVEVSPLNSIKEATFLNEHS